MIATLKLSARNLMRYQRRTWLTAGLITLSCHLDDHARSTICQLPQILTLTPDFWIIEFTTAGFFRKCWPIEVFGAIKLLP